MNWRLWVWNAFWNCKFTFSYIANRCRPRNFQQSHLPLSGESHGCWLECCKTWQLISRKIIPWMHWKLSSASYHYRHNRSCLQKRKSFLKDFWLLIRNTVQTREKLGGCCWCGTDKLEKFRLKELTLNDFVVQVFDNICWGIFCSYMWNCEKFFIELYPVTMMKSFNFPSNANSVADFKLRPLWRHSIAK